VPPWLKYCIIFAIGWLFGAGIITIQMVADSLQAIINAFTPH
jgi:hypothetical protein